LRQRAEEVALERQFEEALSMQMQSATSTSEPGTLQQDAQKKTPQPRGQPVQALKQKTEPTPIITAATVAGTGNVGGGGGHDGDGDGNGDGDSAAGGVQMTKSAKRRAAKSRAITRAQTSPVALLQPPAQAPAVASLFSVGKLRVHHLVLGEGSMGTRVFRGEHADWGAVAVKVMMKVSMAAQGMAGKRSAAEKERQLLLRLAAAAGAGSDNVIKYRCVEEDPERVFIGMELCVCSLHDVISRPAAAVAAAAASGGMLPRIDSQAKRMCVARELMAGTVFLHSHGVVHSDIRPKNILFAGASSGGQLGTLKLADFGLSKEGIETTDQSFTMTMTPTGMGGWYAPEVQRRGKKTQKVDVFMAGCCVCYIMADGRHPFDAHDCPIDDPNHYVRSANVLTGKHDLGPLLKLVCPQHPSAFDLLQSMVDIEAEERPTAAEALAHPFFWSDEERHGFMCDCGNLEEVKSRGKAALEALPPSLMPPGGAAWSDALDPALWRQAQACAGYDGRSVPDLLRFLRNVQQHGGDRGMEAGMAVAASEPGGPAAYFGRLFPWLLMPVWHAAGALGGAQQQAPAAAAGGKQQQAKKPVKHTKQTEQVPAAATAPAVAAVDASAAPALSVPVRLARLEQEYDLPCGKAGGLIPRLKALELLVNGAESKGTLPARVAALEEVSGW
jgi:serine/threonine-protein kinase/endoribonuclease IRE1